LQCGVFRSNLAFAIVVTPYRRNAAVKDHVPIDR